MATEMYTASHALELMIDQQLTSSIVSSTS